MDATVRNMRPTVTRSETEMAEDGDMEEEGSDELNGDEAKSKLYKW